MVVIIRGHPLRLQRRKQWPSFDAEHHVEVDCGPGHQDSSGLECTHARQLMCNRQDCKKKVKKMQREDGSLKRSKKNCEHPVSQVLTFRLQCCNCLQGSCRLQEDKYACRNVGSWKIRVHKFFISSSQIVESRTHVRYNSKLRLSGLTFTGSHFVLDPYI